MIVCSCCFVIGVGVGGVVVVGDVDDCCWGVVGFGLSGYMWDLFWVVVVCLYVVSLGWVVVISCDLFVGVLFIVVCCKVGECCVGVFWVSGVGDYFGVVEIVCCCIIIIS